MNTCIKWRSLQAKKTLTMMLLFDVIFKFCVKAMSDDQEKLPPLQSQCCQNKNSFLIDLEACGTDEGGALYSGKPVIQDLSMGSSGFPVIQVGFL